MIVGELRGLAGDAAGAVGKASRLFFDHERAPRVLIANSNLVGEWANWDEFRRLEARGRRCTVR